MKVTSIETIRVPVQPNLLFVVLHGEAGGVGLGESFFGAEAVEAYIHESAAPVLLAMPDASPEAACLALRPYLGFQGSGVETRGNAALDVALWDLLARRADLPLARLMGGPISSSIRTYNTCAGPSYVRQEPRQASSNWGIDDAVRGAAFEDLDAFLHRPGELAQELLDDGYTAMKIWPFDRAAESSRGNYIDPRDLAHGLGLVEAIRTAVGDRMDVLIEMHGLWKAPAAATIVRALNDLSPYWIEDPVRPDAYESLARLRDVSDSWIASGETLTGRRSFEPLLRQRLIDVATLDVMWCGGLTEARKIAAMAEAHDIPIAPHDCTGPVALATCAHLVMSQPNGLIQETTRAFLRTWYADLVTGVPKMTDGQLSLTGAPGHGVQLRPGLRDEPGVSVRSTTAAAGR